MDYEANTPVITGYGARTPLGYNARDIWTNVKEGKTAIRDISETHPHVVDLAKIENPAGSLFKYFNPREIRSDMRNDPGYFIFDGGNLPGLRKNAVNNRVGGRGLTAGQQLALTTTYEALNHARLQDTIIPTRMGVVTGVGMIDGTKILAEWEVYNGRKAYLNGINGAVGRETVSEENIDVDNVFLPKILPDAHSGIIAKTFGLQQGSAIAINAACASGSAAVCYAADQIRLNKADAMVCSATTMVGDEVAYKGFELLQCLSPNNDPDTISRPFDTNRAGLVIGEGSATMILERYESAMERGAPIYGVIRGYAEHTDTKGSFVKPSEDLEEKVMQEALKQGNLLAEDIGMISPHGTGTTVGDAAEAKAIYNLFGNEVPLYATKGTTAHCFGTTSLHELIFGLQIMQEGGIIPASRNFSESDIASQPPVTTKSTPARNNNYLLSNAFAFYGHMNSLVIENPHT